MVLAKHTGTGMRYLIETHWDTAVALAFLAACVLVVVATR